MLSHLRFSSDRTTPEGVVVHGIGRVLVTQDMDEFETLCYPKHPFASFIFRKPSSGVMPVDWDELLDGTIVGRECDEWIEDNDKSIILRAHQEQGIVHVVEKLDGKAVLAPDPGMGKTLMAILLAKHYGGKCLFIVPSTLAIQWIRELKRISGVTAQHFSTRKSTINSDVVVTTYGMVRDCVNVFLATKWDFVCVDESENIKRESQQGMAVCKVVSVSGVRVLMSGTPQTCSPVDLFNQLYCLYPDVFTNRTMFAERYTQGYYDDYGKWIVEQTVQNLADELNMLLNTVMYRITDDKQENLPMKHRHIVPMVCRGENLKSLEALIKDRKQCCEKISTADLSQQRVLKTELRTICNAIRHTAGRIKAKICLEWVRDFVASQLPHEKYVFFVDHIDTITNLSSVLDTLGFEYGVIYGGVDIAKRAEYVASIADPSHPLRFLIASYKTCAQGVTLCPGARFVFFVELAFTPTMMQQAEKRVNREGATKEAMLYWFRLENTTDDKILRTLQCRFRDNAHVVDGKLGQKFVFDVLPTFYEHESGARALGTQARRLFQNEVDESDGSTKSGRKRRVVVE